MKLFEMPSTGRTSNSCFSCKVRKVKCDRGRPSCERCQKSNIQCEYGPDAVAPRELHVIDSVFGERVSSSSLDDAGKLPRVPHDSISQINSRLDRLTNIVQGFYQSQNQGDSESVRQLRNKPENSGYLEPKGYNGATYLADTHWACINNEVNEIRSLLGGSLQTDYFGLRKDEKIRSGQSHPADEMLMPPNTLTSDGHSISTTSEQVFQRALTANIPTKSQCDFLINAYMIGYHPIAGYVDTTSFFDRYELFWSWAADMQHVHSPETSFIALLKALLFAGSVSCDIGQRSVFFPAEENLHISSILSDSAERALRLANFPRAPSIDALTAYMILHSTRLRAEEPLACCAFVGLAVRIAQMMGLHKDPIHFSGFTQHDSEFRRRLWWHILHIDTITSSWAGMPWLVDSSSWDVKPISELKEQYVGSQDASEIATDKSDDHAQYQSTVGILLAGKFEDSGKKFLNRRLTSVNSADLNCFGKVTTRNILDVKTKGEGPREAKIAEAKRLLENLESSLSNRIRHIEKLENYQRKSGIEDHENNPRLNRFAKLLLSALIDKTWSLVCDKIAQGPYHAIWPNFLPQAITHCQNLIRKTVILASVDDFSPFQWSWPGNHQPLHGLAVLLKNLDHEPRGPFADSSRSVIDEAFSLCSPGGGITGTSIDAPWPTLEVPFNQPSVQQKPRPLTENGQRTWQFLWQWRARVWSKAGLDPNNCMTREQAISSAQGHARELGIVEEDEDWLLSSVNWHPPPDFFDFGSQPGLGEWDQWDMLNDPGKLFDPDVLPEMQF
ncbi:hypothetical protein L228DRAFT_259270 [Xylona heveae TC161]|uniref:Zn(2)-C6 fungal-type domain-containing protein n=1 Tax=Xylona heveae (strain CBS 132557 / TC161) TaxID=1328760 RepID=A0A165HVT0_XYLHT|nr:hypothetical protein L228DRAFT_259270 [Xylona heveae TC161]KZF23989.1 hypothetical protein L228DRAFT_259270 [Xylona heveae TC161]